MDSDYFPNNKFPLVLVDPEKLASIQTSQKAEQANEVVSPAEVNIPVPALIPPPQIEYTIPSVPPQSHRRSERSYLDSLATGAMKVILLILVGLIFAGAVAIRKKFSAPKASNS